MPVWAAAAIGGSLIGEWLEPHVPVAALPHLGGGLLAGSVVLLVWLVGGAVRPRRRRPGTADDPAPEPRAAGDRAPESGTADDPAPEPRAAGDRAPESGAAGDLALGLRAAGDLAPDPAVTDDLAPEPGPGATAVVVDTAPSRRGSRAGRPTAAGTSPLPGGRGLVAAIAILAACAGGTALRIATTELGLLPELAGRGGQAHVEATVITEPRPIATGWQLLVRVHEVDGVATRERAAVTLEGEPPPLGTRFVGPATAQPLPDGGYGRWLARQHAVVVLTPRGWQPAGEPGWFTASSETVRARVRDAATRHLDDARGGLLVGLVTGDTRLLPEENQDEMLATGLTHLTAVSGMHVAVVIAGVLGLTAALRMGAGARRLAVAAVVPWFAFVTRFEPSVLRAGTMTALLLLASMRGVARDARHALAGAVLVLVLIDPRLAGSLGLLLSATATAGVLVVAPVVRTRLPARLPRRAAELLSITIGAQIAVVPLLLGAFGELSLVSIPANMVAVPAAGVAASLAFTGSVLALLHVDLGAWLFAVAGVPAGVVLETAHHLAGVGGVVEVARPATVVALLAGCAWLVRRRGSRAGPWLAVVVVVAVLAASVPLAAGRLPASGFTLTAIDVGQGDAFLIESPGARVLVDAGEDDTAARWLRRHGRTRLDLVVVSHPHLDHVGGVPDVLRALTVDVLWMSAIPTELPQAAQTLAVAAERGIPVRAPVADEVAVVGDLVIEVLHPPPDRPFRFARSELNESSYVLRVHHDGRRILLTGDVELEGQAMLLATRPDQLAAELFTVPHHGSATTDADFLAAIGGQAGVIGVGEDNRHGHPNPTTLAALDALDVEVRRTDLEGTVTIEVPHPVATTPPSGVPPPAGVTPGVGWEHGSRAAADRRRRATAPT